MSLDATAFIGRCFFALQARCRVFYLWNADSPSCGNLRLFLNGFRKPNHFDAIPQWQIGLDSFNLAVREFCKVIPCAELLPHIFLGWDKADAFFANPCVNACFIEEISSKNFTNKFGISFATDNLVSSRIDGNLILPASLNGLIDSF